MFHIYWYGFDLNSWLHVATVDRDDARVYRAYRDYRVLTAVGGSFDASTLAVMP